MKVNNLEYKNKVNIDNCVLCANFKYSAHKSSDPAAFPHYNCVLNDLHQQQKLSCHQCVVCFQVVPTVQHTCR